jgi:signal transduction histidine kinase
MELSAARTVRQKVLLLEDRSRIARDLHDHVIQQLFATGLQLHNIAGQAAARSVADDVLRTVASIDSSIAQIRTAIFALTVQDDEPRGSTRHRMIDLVNEMSPGFPSTPAVSFHGPVDLIVADDLAEDVIAVTREALANVVKHAAAQHTSIALSVGAGTVSLTVDDDGVGFVPSGRTSGIGNLEQRALRRGGGFALTATDSGTRLAWTVPMPDDPDDLGDPDDDEKGD